MRKVMILFALLFAPPLQAEELYEWEAERVHSDLPLYTFDWDDVWPRGMTGPDIIAGCESRVAFGDWEFKPNPDDEFGDPYWIRVANYGAFHCAANLYNADEREGLDEGGFSRGLFARIGETRKGGELFELWALQEGFVPGSDYLLLARKAENDDLITRFEVLQRRCPRSRMREVDGLDIWTTSYCSINTRGELLRLAKRMLREPALGTLSLAKEEGPVSEETGPTNSEASN